MEKGLPQNEAAERATLGALILDRDAIVAINAWLRAEHFFTAKHGWIYAAIEACYKRQTPPDLVNVAEELRTRGQLDQIGGVPFLVDLSNSVPTAFHVEYYAKTVWKTAWNRRGIAAGGKIANLYFDEDRDPEEVDAEAERLLREAQTEVLDTDMQTIDEVINARYERLNQPATAAVPTGLVDLDRLLAGGFHNDDLIIIAARPGVGKSSMMMHMARNQIFLPDPYRVHVASLEMKNENLLDRMLSTDTEIDLQVFRRNVFTQAELGLVVEAMGRYHEKPLTIDQRMTVTIEGLRQRVLLQSSRVGKPAILYVDYLQLLGGAAPSKGRTSANRQEEVSNVARGLKALARELNIPVVALAQLSREAEKQDGPPLLSHLRESGEIEQAADVVIFPYRPDDAEETLDQSVEAVRQRKPTLVELHVPKHRNGPKGMVAVFAEFWNGRWFNAAGPNDY